MFFLPIRQHFIGCLRQFRVRIGQRRIDHRQFMRIGTNRLHFVAHGDQAIRRAGEFGPQPLAHRLNRPVLPQKGMSASRAEIGDAQFGNFAQAGDLFPKFRHGAGIEHFNLEAPQPLQHHAAAHFHQHRQDRNFPQHHFGPIAFKAQFKLAVAFCQMVGRQAHALEPFHEIRAKHLTLAIKRVAAQPGAFPARQRQRADMVQLLAQFTFVDNLGQPDRIRPVDQAERDNSVGLVAENRLAHQKFVKIRVNQRPDDRVDLPFVVPHPRCDIDHFHLRPFGKLGQRCSKGQSPLACFSKAVGGQCRLIAATRSTRDNGLTRKPSNPATRHASSCSP